jgi:hypothetical protein
LKNIKIILLIALSFIINLFCTEGLLAQNGSNIWKTLAKVSFKTKTEGKYKTEYPVFESEVWALQGKEVVVRGYILPLETGLQNQFIFSLYPYSNCYFCGGAGPETVMEVYPKSPINFSSKPVTIKGKFKLNDKNYEQLMYILENAVLSEAQ